MLRRVFLLLAVLLVLSLAVVLLGPFLIPATSTAGQEQAAAVAPASSRFVAVPFPGTQGISLHYQEAGPTWGAAAGSGDSNITGTDAVRAAGEGADLGGWEKDGRLGREEGPTFILLHGFTFNLFTWDSIRDFLATRGRVLAYDQIPYGLSAKLTATDWSGPNPYSKEAAIEQLFAFMDVQGVGRAILVGNSSGGTLAMEAALARPERVAGLILVAPWVYAQRPTLPAWVAELPQLRRLSLLIGRKLGEGVLLNYSYADPGRIDDSRRALMTVHAQVRDWDLAWGELLNRSLSSPVTVSARLAGLIHPVLLVSGDQDKVVPMADTRRVADALPDAALAVIPGCGHVPQEECPRAFEQAVAAWLAAHPVLGGVTPAVSLAPATLPSATPSGRGVPSTHPLQSLPGQSSRTVSLSAPAPHLLP